MAGRYKRAKNKRTGQVALQRIIEHGKCLQYVFLILVQFLLVISKEFQSYLWFLHNRSPLFFLGIMSILFLNLCKFLT